jgi:hypothetical protein
VYRKQGNLYMRQTAKKQLIAFLKEQIEWLEKTSIPDDQLICLVAIGSSSEEVNFAGYGNPNDQYQLAAELLKECQNGVERLVSKQIHSESQAIELWQ